MLYDFFICESKDFSGPKTLIGTYSFEHISRLLDSYYESYCISHNKYFFIDFHNDKSCFKSADLKSADSPSVDPCN